MSSINVAEASNQKLRYIEKYTANIKCDEKIEIIFWIV